jgi:hypothetical protein
MLPVSTDFHEVIRNKERGLFLVWGPAPNPPGFLRHELSSDEIETGAKPELHARPHRVDELTALFLSAVASPQSRPPLHPVRSTYEEPDPAQVSFRIRHNFSFTPH